MKINALPVVVVSHTWTAMKKDDRVTKKACQMFEASPEAGRFSKFLIDSQELRKIVSLDVMFKAKLREMTLSFVSDLRLLPAGLYFKFAQELNEYKMQRQKLVSGLLAKYEDYVQDAKARLGKMFRMSDYPPLAELQRKFAVDVLVLPAVESDQVPEAFRAVLEEQTERIKHELEERIAGLQKQIEELKQKEKANKKTKERINNTFETLQNLNVLEDQEIQQKIEKLVEIWGGVR